MAEEEKVNKNNPDDISAKTDRLIQILSELSQSDVSKIESLAKGEKLQDTEEDERVLKYLTSVNALLGSSNSMQGDHDSSRRARYNVYDEMEDTVAYISSVLDILSDDATQPDEDGVVLHVSSDNSKVQNIVEDMIIELEIQENVSKWARVIAKYGDFFIEIVGEEGEGVSRLKDSHYPGNIDRKELDGDLAAYVDNSESDPRIAVRAPWEFIHFRHKGDIYKEAETGGTVLDGYRDRVSLSASYGQSHLLPAIKVYSQLRFVENIIILSRLTNSIRRNIFLINTGDVSATKSVETVQLYANLLKKDITLDLDKGIYDSKKQTVKYDEDIFLPVSDTRNDVRVEQIGGDVNITEQYDLEYLLNKLFAALKVPKAYLNYEQDLNARSTLIQLDIRYARSVSRLQQTVVGGILRLAKIHLAYKGIDPTKVDLQISLSSVSSIEAEIRREEREQNINNARSFLDIVGDLSEKLSPSTEKDEDGEPIPGTPKLDTEYAAYFAMKEYMDMKDDDLEKLFKFDISKYQSTTKGKSKDSTEGTKEVTGRLKEHRIYKNADLKAPLPSTDNEKAYGSIREALYKNYIEESEEVDSGGETERLREG